MIAILADGLSGCASLAVVAVSIMLAIDLWLAPEASDRRRQRWVSLGLVILITARVCWRMSVGKL